ncbi:anti-sigma B factor antagonist [Poseidonocella pacifica]|uniref:Anti-sigma factor antagonist n=1 Tax=Poseidonocella pacifica TaxID=871651 RepID=A0A1I0XNW5_9RHOB|nr:STAS domain-containing protein [Poseidonocella pacifica]SFB01653.1 anti-sigma B factor antagonist [Poseidonocella pacifica]
MDIRIEPHPDAHVVHVAESRIDASSAIQFKDKVRNLIDGVEGRVLLDLGEVDFVDSSGLGAIVAVMKMLGAGRRLELAALRPNVEKVFRLTRMDKVFIIHDSVEIGLAPHAA